MSSQADPTIEHNSTQHPSPSQQPTTGAGPLVPTAAIVLAILGIMLIVAAHAWWATLLAIVIESAVVALIVLYMQSVTTTRRRSRGAVIDLANRDEGQDELSEHDVPMGAPERGAVKHAHEHDHPVATPRR